MSRSDNTAVVAAEEGKEEEQVGWRVSSKKTPTVITGKRISSSGTAEEFSMKIYCIGEKNSH